VSCDSSPGVRMHNATIPAVISIRLNKVTTIMMASFFFGIALSFSFAFIVFSLIEINIFFIFLSPYFCFYEFILP
jgi:hypothetical protein